MVFRRQEWFVTNVAAVTTGVLLYPLAETGGPNDLDRRDNFPLKNFKVENQSGVILTVLLDSVGVTANQRFTVPSGQTLASDTDDDFTFYNITILNEGVIDAPIGSIDVNVRNY